jgi:hypothetical protein
VGTYKYWLIFGPKAPVPGHADCIVAAKPHPVGAIYSLYALHPGTSSGILVLQYDDCPLPSPNFLPMKTFPVYLVARCCPLGKRFEL